MPSTPPSSPRVRLRPTRACLTLMVVLFAVMLGAVNYQSNAAYLVLSLVGSVALVSALHAWRNLARLELVPGYAEPAFAGEPLRATISVANHGKRTVYALECSLPDALAGECAVSIAALDAGQTRALALLLLPRARGLHAIGRVRLSTTFPMGLFRAWFDAPASLVWVVYPRPLFGAPAESEADEAAEGSGGAQSGSGDFRGHRAYVVGDSQRHVDWKAVARGRPLLVKEYAGGARARTWIEWSAAGEADLETRLSRLAGWVVEADRDGAVYGLRLPDRAFAPAGGHLHYHACLGALALVTGRP